MTAGNIVVPLLFLFLCDYVSSIKTTDMNTPPGNASVPAKPAFVKERQPSNLISWYNMMHSFVDGMYMPGRTPLIILWVDKSLENGGDNNGKIFTQVNREGHRRVFQNGGSGVFVIFLIILTLTLMISGWFTCGYRIIGLCGARPSHLLDNEQAVAFRIIMLVLMLILMIGIIVFIYYALANTIYANHAFSEPVVASMKRDLKWIDDWVSNFSQKYAKDATGKHLSPTHEDILKAVTDAYRGYYGYVFSKAGIHLLEHEIKVLSKYTYYTFQAYYQILTAHSAFNKKAAKINALKNGFTTTMNDFLKTCKDCDYYKPFKDNLYFNSLKMNTTLENFVFGVSSLATSKLFGMYDELITNRMRDILLQIPDNKTLYTDLVSFLKEASDTYYTLTFNHIQTAVNNFANTFWHLTNSLRNSGGMGSIYSGHIARHVFTILFCTALLIAIAITLVGLVLGCVLPPRPLSEELPYKKHRCRELPAMMLNVSAIIVFLTILFILIFVITIFIVGVPYEWGYCQFLMQRYPNGLNTLSKKFHDHNPKSPMKGLFSSLLGRCLSGSGTMFEMLQLMNATDWNATYSFLKNFNRTAEDIYNVPDNMVDKFPEDHPFLRFCDFYENAVTGDVQLEIDRLPVTTLNLDISSGIAYKSHELPLEMRTLSDSTGNKQANLLYNNLKTIVAMDLLLDSLKRSYLMAHPWRYLGMHLRNVKELYNKTRSWFYSPKRVGTTKYMFLKYAAASLNLLFKDVLKRDMPCAGIGGRLDLYFSNFCNTFSDPWNATWLIFLFMILLLVPFLLGLFVLIVCYRKQSDRSLSDLQYMTKKCCRAKHVGDDIPPKPKKPKKEEPEESDSDKSVAIIGFNHGCYICCRTFTICSNFLIYLLLCKWKDRKKRAKRMNADPQKRRSISELPDNFFPAPVVVPLGCGPHLVGKCCCLNLEKKRRSEIEEDMRKRRERKAKKAQKKREKKKKQKARELERAQEMQTKGAKGEGLRDRLLNEAEVERQTAAVVTGERGTSEDDTPESEMASQQELIARQQDRSSMTKSQPRSSQRLSIKTPAPKMEKRSSEEALGERRGEASVQAHMSSISEKDNSSRASRTSKTSQLSFNEKE